MDFITIFVQFLELSANTVTKPQPNNNNNQQKHSTTMTDLLSIVSHFDLKGTVEKTMPLGTGLINDTYKATTREKDAPDYVLQRVNHTIFTDVDMLQGNIEAVTRHIRRKLEERGETDIDRKVLSFVTADTGKTYWHDGQNYWRMMVFIPRARTHETVSPEYARHAGAAFGNFEAMLADIPDRLGDTIPGFHDMELRLAQFREAVRTDAAGRAHGVDELIGEIERRAHDMCLAERLHREGRLPKRVCHCDTKVNNIMFDENGTVLCVIDLDTVMPNYVFSDYGDFLRSAANTGLEDDPNPDNVAFDMDIFRAFTEGYLSSARQFLLPDETDNLAYAAALFPYMQCTRFLTDYINGDTYYKTQYTEHNLVRTHAQLRLLQSVEEHAGEMRSFINSCL